MKPGDVVKLMQGAGTFSKMIRQGEYGIVVRVIPGDEIRRSKGFPCGQWFDVFTCGSVNQVRHDFMEIL